MIRFDLDGHTFEGESRNNGDGTFTIKGWAVCGPHDDEGNHANGSQA